MNLRISIAAAVAVLLASLSLHAVLQGNGWLAAGFGAVVSCKSSIHLQQRSLVLGLGLRKFRSDIPVRQFC